MAAFVSILSVVNGTLVMARGGSAQPSGGTMAVAVKLTLHFAGSALVSGRLVNCGSQFMAVWGFPIERVSICEALGG